MHPSPYGNPGMPDFLDRIFLEINSWYQSCYTSPNGEEPMRDNFTTFKNSRVFVFGLAVECPYGKETADCPMKNLRPLPLKTRMENIKSMTSNQMEGILTYHEECLKLRVGK
jgi:hypothetical protein